MKTFLSCLGILAATLFASADEAATLVSVHKAENYSKESVCDGTLTELLAAQQDIDASSTWEPNLPMPVSLGEIVKRAREAVEKPAGKLVYSEPELRGVDLRRIDGVLWCWEVHFGFMIDHSINGQAFIKDSDVFRSVKFLPNGGKLTEKKRTMTSEERIFYGVDQKPNAPESFDGSDPFAPKRQK